jgi:hypothetical protein
MAIETITVWVNNRLDSEEVRQIDDLAKAYLASVYPNIDMLFERKVTLFLANDNHLTWTDKAAFDALLDRILALRET